MGIDLTGVREAAAEMAMATAEGGGERGRIVMEGSKRVL